MFAWLRRRRRPKVAPPPPLAAGWQAHLDRLPWAARLDADERARLEARIVAFVGAKRWEGCAGLEVTDEMKVVVAAHAARLALHLPDDAYWKVETILLYPSSFVIPGGRSLGATVPRDGMVLAGEAWHGPGPVVVSWLDAIHSAQNAVDGQNLLLHEFAHKLDMLDGWADGTPRLRGRAEYAAWREVVARERVALDAALDAGRRTVLDPYASTNEAEFFAVATETFFEKPRRLRDEHPDLYACLAAYFKQDPAAL